MLLEAWFSARRERGGPKEKEANMPKINLSHVPSLFKIDPGRRWLIFQNEYILGEMLCPLNLNG